MTPTYLFRVTSERKSVFLETLYCFIAVANPSCDELSEALTREITDHLAPDEIVFLCPLPAVGSLSDGWSKGDFASLLSRLPPDTPISTVSFGPLGAAGPTTTLHGTPQTKTSFANLMRQGATQIFRNRGGFIEPNTSYHFENPSGKHTDRFIRLSNLLSRQVEISFLAFALLPSIPSETRLAYIDTPSLFAVVAAVNELLRILSPSRPAIIAENFQSYASFSPEGSANRSTFFDRKNEAVVIISASSSGGLARRIAKEHSFSAERLIHLLYLGDGVRRSNIAINLAKDRRFNPKGYSGEKSVYEKSNCELCLRGSKAIPLLGDQFDIRGPQPDPVVILKKDAPVNLDETVARLIARGALTIQGTPPTFMINSVKLLEIGEYKKRLEFFARRFIPAGVSHCFVDSENSKAVATFMAATTNQTFPVYLRDDISKVGIVTETQVAPILIVVDVIASGRILLEISRDLRNVAPNAPLIYIAGFGKFPSAQAKEAIRKNLVQTLNAAPHAFQTVDELILPGLELTSAWRSELAFLQKSKRHWDDSARGLLGPRLDRLRKTSMPFENDLFLSNTDKPLAIQNGFAFWSEVKKGASQADVFYTIASVVQALRVKQPSPQGAGLKNNWLQQTLIAPENFGRYNDGVIQASILRACSPAELEYSMDPALSQDMARIIKRIVLAANQSRGEAAAEFLLAMATRRLTLTHSDVSQVLAPCSGLPDIVESLRLLAREILL
ncbi:hypothetical protein [Parasphingorhabdus flavimaris]|uniref:hypothetical protein n=1 Tax=Parasphingorhabdus flavimaris TaxID=266812 RepID=UPI0030011C0D